MKHLAVQALVATSTLLLVTALSGCVTPAGRDAERLRQDELLKRMDACLARQEETGKLLQSQSRQIDEQQSDLDDLAEGLASIGIAVGGAGSAATATTPDCAAGPQGEKKLVVGRMEQVWLPDLELALPARVDTGAETASLDARNIELFERNGRRWVKFEILNTERDEPILVERRLKRMVSIVQSNVTEPERRPVVKMSITIGDVNQTAEFTLSNRSHLDYQVLIGRNILQDVMLVDVSKKNIAPYSRAAPEQR